MSEIAEPPVPDDFEPELTTDDQSADEKPERASLGQREPSTGRVLLSRSNTPPSAIAFRRDWYTSSTGWPTLYSFQGNFYARNESLNRYERVDDAQVRSEVQRYLFHAVENHADTIRPFSVTAKAVSDAVDAIRNVSYLDSRLTPPFRDGIELPSLVFGKTRNFDVRTGTVAEPDPVIFNVDSLAFDPDPKAPAPARFTEFLDDLFGEDLVSVQTLREYIGYCLVRDTGFQKMLLLIGPKRSGKGTLGRLIAQLVGESAVVGPTVSGLAGPFGLQQLLGKRVAIVGDARFSGPDVATFTERVLTISGGDAVTIDQKHREAVTKRLPIKFIFLTNEAPRFSDASSALVSRFLVLKLAKSFYGREDHRLFDQLCQELPGIFNWAVAGLRQLYARGRFVQPKAGEELVEAMADLSSPVSVFVRECCDLGHEERSTCDEVYQRFRRWCEVEGHSAPSKQLFSRNLRAAHSEIETKQGTDGRRFFVGISVRTEVPHGI